MKYFIKFLMAGAITCLLISVSPAGTVELKGKVRHANTYQGIPNVNIYIEGTKTGTSSASDGTFSLLVSDPPAAQMVVFEHVAFDTLRLTWQQALDRSVFYLSPRIIALPEILVQAQRDQPEIARDIPQRLAVVDAKYFEIQGYVDAGDLLNTQQSIQINEDISGEKNISIRAGNPEDVIILYNGVKLNDLYDNTFDLAQLNLEDLSQIEIIRGSNTALYGAEAFSGVVNFVPKTFRNYTVRFAQRFGTYNAGDWNLQLNHTFANKLNICYMVKNGSLRRRYANVPGDSAFLQNKIIYHSANISYPFSENIEKNRMTAGYLYSSSDFTDIRYNDELDKLNQIYSLQYEGDIGFVSKLSMAASYQTFDRDENLSETTISGPSLQDHSLDRSFRNRKTELNLQKTFSIRAFDLLLAYQYEDTRLSYRDRSDSLLESTLNLRSLEYQSARQGLVSILKIHTPTGSEILHTADFDLSVRHDQVYNRPRDAAAAPVEGLKSTRWNQSTVKFSAFLSGNQRYYKISTFLNFGTNIKFPTLFQQLSTPRILDPALPGISANLKPEKNRSFELGFELTRELSFSSNINGWKMTGSYFTNYYENKFRTYYIPSIAVAFFDNVPNADISGFEGQFNTYFFFKKLCLQLGATHYSVSDKTAFPFKSDNKFFADILIDHKGYSLQVYWFDESEQSGLIRDRDGELTQLTLPARQNVDIHFGKVFEVYRFKFFTNFSIRNLLNDPTRLTGIAIRDRRYYLSFGLEY